MSRNTIGVLISLKGIPEYLTLRQVAICTILIYFALTFPARCCLEVIGYTLVLEFAIRKHATMRLDESKFIRHAETSSLEVRFSNVLFNLPCVSGLITWITLATGFFCVGITSRFFLLHSSKNGFHVPVSGRKKSCSLHGHGVSQISQVPGHILRLPCLRNIYCHSKLRLVRRTCYQNWMNVIWSQD